MYICTHMHTSRFVVVEDILAALGHRVRLDIVNMLLGGERCVCEIAPGFRQERSVISRHLSALENAGIIRSRRSGRRVFYQIADHRVVALLDTAREMINQPGKARPVGPQSGIECCLKFESRRRNAHKQS